MPPKTEAPTMTVLATDEEWATVHGEECSEGVKGFLHAVMWTRNCGFWLRLCRWLRSQLCRGRQ